MGVPKKRKTKSAKRQRRSHHALSAIQLAKCKNCGAAVLPHEVCRDCGFYKGRLVKSELQVAASKSAKKQDK